jgi:hypothetical protein
MIRLPPAARASHGCYRHGTESAARALQSPIAALIKSFSWIACVPREAMRNNHSCGKWHTPSSADRLRAQI